MMARNTLDFSSSFQRQQPTAIIMPSSLPFPLSLHHHHYPLTTPTPYFIIIRQKNPPNPKETTEEEAEEEEEEEDQEEEEEEEEGTFPYIYIYEKTLLLSSFNLL
jgi:hypothetical protein